MDPNSCFLCAPSHELSLTSSTSLYAMVGLGPITTTYALIVAKTHVRSMADLALENLQIAGELMQLKRSLEKAAGPLLMTEHGRVPICRTSGDYHDQHCFHAHTLLFSCPTGIITEARSYYAKAKKFEDLKEALDYAATTSSYLLISESWNQYYILSEPLNAPRQLARTLVAIKSGHPNLADWRSNPRRDQAVLMAQSLRQRLEQKL